MFFNPAGQSMPILGMLRALPRIRAAIKAECPDVIVAFMHSTYVPVTFATLGLPLPLVVSEHTVARHYQTRPFQRQIRKIADSIATLRTVPSESARQSFLNADASDCVVVPNPISTVVRSSSDCRYDRNSKVAVSVGVMRPEKDHATLIDAFAQVADAFPDWRLRIVGDGPLRPQLEAQVARLNLQDRVEMPGIVRDMVATYEAARFVVLPSRYESFGMVAAEALAAGRAVLSFDDCTGIAEIVESGHNGLLVHGTSDGDIRVLALAQGMWRMMAEPDACKSMGEKGPASVAHFGVDRVLDVWDGIFRDVTGQNTA